MTLTKPLIAITPGDPCGIGPELAVRLAARPESQEQADIVLVGDLGVIREGERAAGIRLELAPVNNPQRVLAAGRVLHLDTDTISSGDLVPGRHSPESTRSSMSMLATAVDLVQGGGAAGILAMPMLRSLPRQNSGDTMDVAEFLALLTDTDRPVCEIAAMSSLWVTSVAGSAPLSEVASMLDRDRIFRTCSVMHEALQSAGLEKPRIAVTSYNPLIAGGGEGGREEQAAVIPAIERARARGMDCEGPFAAETIFKQALSDGIDAVVTMYHDQARIATSLMGFERGLAVYGGLPFRVLSPAHGPMFELAGKGKADPEAAIASFNLLLSTTIRRTPAFRFRGDSGMERKR
ncbi:MAG: 4-hydroxythreonine-4-phosphate dehydrogenase PdxA [Geminicoccaceae bacterium]|nr:4-hydroxythreonine-4-phosphate dehydrogenase PdxA [Geminicoccaceae bacterium]